MEMMNAEQWAAQQAAGTWSELFSRSALINRVEWLTVIFWLAAFWLLGLIFMPLTAVIFRSLKDKDWGISKFFGLMVFGYTVWLCASLGLDYSRRTILSVLLGWTLVNALILLIRKDRLLPALRSLKTDILWADGVFFACFCFFLAIRIMNPDLWHPYKGGERPMDFSYFNAILKSTNFPPYDPWFAGGTMNYYYYGIYLSGLMVKLLGVIPSAAFNLNLALWYGFLGSAAFSIGKTLYLHAEKDPDGSGANRAGIFSVIGMQVIGNLGTVIQIKNELIELGMSGTGLPKGFGAFCKGIAKLLSGERLLMYQGDWYWIPSRAIPDTSITEFPFFTFLYGDPHAHLFALPMTVLVLVWLATMILRVGAGKRTAALEWIAVFAAGALLIGTLIPTNTWDMPTYFGVTAVVLIYLGLRYGFFEKDKESRGVKLRTLAVILILFTVLTAAYFIPYLRTNSRENIIEAWDETRIPVSSFLMHWGVFLYFITAWYVTEIYRWMKYTSLRECREMLARSKGWLLAGVTAAALILVSLSIDGVPVIWITLPLMVLSLLLLLRKDITDLKRFVHFLVGTAMFAATLVEMIHLAGDVGRMNTVFKFYNQIWVMLAVCAAFGLACMLRAVREEALQGRFLRVYRTTGCLLVFGAFLYTVFAGTDKMTDRMSERAPRTIDGMKYMETSGYWQDGFYMDLSEDYEAILWMQENIQGSPVIVEASPTEYKWGSRFTVYTGLPGVVGWNYHQRQQRGPMSGMVWDRVNGIHDFYNTSDPETAAAFLERYGVQYIIVGQMEKGMYSPEGIAKFSEQDGILWDCVYDRENTQIYKVRNEEKEMGDEVIIENREM